MSATAQRSWSGKIHGISSIQKPRQKVSKYRAQPVVVSGVRYASKSEEKRHRQLLLLQQSGEISDLNMQVSFELVPSVRFEGSSRAKPAMRYVADFVYLDKSGKRVIEDVKGVLTPEFQLKRHLMLALLGLHIKIVKAR